MMNCKLLMILIDAMSMSYRKKIQGTQLYIYFLVWNYCILTLKAIVLLLLDYGILSL